MLYMIMHKVDATMESGTAPVQRIVKEMGEFIGGLAQSGKLRTGAGLKQSATRVRIHSRGGECTRTQGPLRGHNELVTGFVMLEVATIDDAIAWSERIAKALGDVEVDVGPVTEPWDIGVAPKPTGVVPVHALVLPKADAAYEAGKPLAPERAPAYERVIEDMKKAGVFMETAALEPSSTASRLRRFDGKASWVDGPFAESKELIAGFAIVQVETRAEVVKLTERYAEILGEVEVDIREVRE